MGVPACCDRPSATFVEQDPRPKTLMLVTLQVLRTGGAASRNQASSAANFFGFPFEALSGGSAAQCCVAKPRRAPLLITGCEDLAALATSPPSATRAAQMPTSLSSPQGAPSLVPMVTLIYVRTLCLGA